LVINDVFLHILKVQTLVTHPNVSLVPKNRVFMFLKVQNRPKKPISVPEYLSIIFLEHYYKILNPTPKKWDVGTKPLFFIF